MTHEELNAYNETLRTAPLPIWIWEKIDNEVRLNPGLLEDIERDFPLIAIHCKESKIDYHLFLQIVENMLNNDPENRLGARNLSAQVVKNDYGDGSGEAIMILFNGTPRLPVSMLEDYERFKRNGDNGLHMLIDKLANEIIKIF